MFGLGASELLIILLIVVLLFGATYALSRYSLTLHPLLAFGPLALQPGELRGQRDDLLVEFLSGVEPVLAGIGVGAEIADQEPRHRVEGEPGEDRFESATRDHGGPKDGAAGLMDR